jgi:hypothetical protein
VKKSRTALLLLAACVVVAVFAGYHYLRGGKVAGETHSGLGSEVMVMRTRGGLLEVSRVLATEQFDKKFIYTIPGLGTKVGETIAHIRVPAVYRYHIELAPEWQVIRSGDAFTVVTPPVRPSLPVAVDLARMEKDEGGTWVLVPFNREDDLDTLQREITQRLSEKASSPAYLHLQRKAARQTVSEFVLKWLIEQEAWQAAEHPTLKVVLGD